MAITYTVDGTANAGNQRRVFGTFTSAAGDTGGTLGATTHGLNFVADQDIQLGVLGHGNVKITVSAGTVTWLVEDTQGASGRWSVTGA